MSDKADVPPADETLTQSALSATLKVSPSRLAKARMRGAVRADATSFYTIKQVAERMQVADRTVRRWIDSGHLRAHKIGGIVRISEADFAAFIASLRGDQ